MSIIITRALAAGLGIAAHLADQATEDLGACANHLGSDNLLETQREEVRDAPWRGGPSTATVLARCRAARDRGVT